MPIHTEAVLDDFPELEASANDLACDGGLNAEVVIMEDSTDDAEAVLDDFPELEASADDLACGDGLNAEVVITEASTDDGVSGEVPFANFEAEMDALFRQGELEVVTGDAEQGFDDASLRDYASTYPAPDQGPGARCDGPDDVDFDAYPAVLDDACSGAVEDGPQSSTTDTTFDPYAGFVDDDCGDAGGGVVVSLAPTTTPPAATTPVQTGVLLVVGVKARSTPGTTFLGTMNPRTTRISPSRTSGLSCSAARLSRRSSPSATGTLPSSSMTFCGMAGRA